MLYPLVVPVIYQMSLFDNRYYYLTKTLLSVIGQWPSQSRLEAYVTFTITSLFSSSVAALQLWGLIAGITNLSIVMENLPPLLINSLISMKLINCLCKRYKMKQLFAHIEETWKIMQVGPEYKIFLNYAEKSRSYTIQYAIILYGAVILYTTMPLTISGIYFLLPNNETYAPRFLFRLEHVIDVDRYYNVLMLHSFIGMSLYITIWISVDCTFIISVQYVCALFASIGYHMGRIRGSDVLKPNIADDEAYHIIIQCIQSYKRALKYTDLLSSTFATSFLFIIGNVVVSLTFSAAELIMVENQLDEIIRIVACNAGQLVHIFYLSLMSQQLIDHSNGFQDVIYSCNWYNISLRSRQLLRFMSLRATRPCEIKAGKLYVMSMENFSSILRVSASYFTVLTSIR